MKVKITKKDIENCSEKYYKVLNEMEQNYLDDFFCDSALTINDYIKITSIENNYIEIDVDLPIEEKFLLSFANSQQLDAVYYDAEAILWNDIVLNDDNIQEYNHTTVQQENVSALCYEIEQEIITIFNNCTLDINQLTNDLANEIDIDYFIDEYFNFKNDIDTELLKEYLEDGINEIEDLITECVKEYLKSEDYFDFICEIEDLNIFYMYEEINENGFYEAYI